MKNIFFLLIIAISISSCDINSESTTTQSSVTFNFSHAWDNTPVSSTDFNSIKFTTENGDNLSIERLRYLISKITFTTTNNEKLIVNNYELIDVTTNENLVFNSSIIIPSGNYNNLSFTFGFDNTDNYVINGYADLNSASFNVPAMLGGGYHYMQLDGKFINSSTQEQGYNYHAIRAVDASGPSLVFPQDTFFEVDLGPVQIGNNTTLNIEMNIAEWFKTPNRWDLNSLNQMLMPNASAQILMYENGQNVFRLISVN